MHPSLTAQYTASHPSHCQAKISVSLIQPTKTQSFFWTRGYVFQHSLHFLDTISIWLELNSTLLGTILGWCTWPTSPAMSSVLWTSIACYKSVPLLKSCGDHRSPLKQGICTSALFANRHHIQLFKSCVNEQNLSAGLQSLLRAMDSNLVISNIHFSRSNNVTRKTCLQQSRYNNMISILSYSSKIYHDIHWPKYPFAHKQTSNVTEEEHHQQVQHNIHQHLNCDHSCIDPSIIRQYTTMSSVSRELVHLTSLFVPLLKASCVKQNMRPLHL